MQTTRAVGALSRLRERALPHRDNPNDERALTRAFGDDLSRKRER